MVATVLLAKGHPQVGSGPGSYHMGNPKSGSHKAGIRIPGL